MEFDSTVGYKYGPARFMILWLFKLGVGAVVVFSASDAFAQTAATDAFGIISAASFDKREEWAGVREWLSPEGLILETTNPGEAQDVLFFLGPKSLTAGGNPAHAVVLVFDAAGNLVADETEVRILAGAFEGLLTTQTGIAEGDVDPGTVSGLFHAGAETQSLLGLRQSARAEYRVTADIAGIAPTLAPPMSPALSESFASLRIGPLVDPFGNTSEDGVFLTLSLDHGNGAFSVIPASVVGGWAEARVLTRDLPGDATATAFLLARASSPIVFRLSTLRPAAEPFAEIEVIQELSAIRLRVGPFVTSEGYYLNDGALVALKLRDLSGNDTDIQGWLQNGFLSTIVTTPALDELAEIQIHTSLGTTTFRVPQTAAPPSLGPLALEMELVYEPDISLVTALVSAGGMLYRTESPQDSGAVRQLQEFLNHYGYTGDDRSLVVDGYFGLWTQAALRTFQDAFGLFADGVLGPATADAMVFVVSTWSSDETVGDLPLRPSFGMEFIAGPFGSEIVEQPDTATY
jgi:hypothetical protein